MNYELITLHFSLFTFHFSLFTSLITPGTEGVSHPSPLGETERGLLILILPPILFRQGKKLFKLLYPLRFHLPRIHPLPGRLHPIQHIMLLNPILRRIPMFTLHERHHLIISLPPFLVLCHTSITINP